MNILNRRRLMGDKGLPYDAEVEYIQTDGKAFIDTGIKTSSNLTFDLNLYIPSHGTQGVWMFGSRVSASNGQMAYLNDPSHNTKDWRYYNEAATSGTILSSGNYNFKNTANVNILKINDTTTLSAPSATFTSDYNFYILTLNVAGTPAFINIGNGARIMPSKIYLSGVLVRDYIAVRKDGVGYLYDKVSGKLFGNANSEGTFSYGADIVEIEYLESTGTLWINSNIQVNSNLSCLVTYITDALHNLFGNPIIGSSSGSSKNYHVTLYNNKYFYGTGTSERSSGSSNYNVKHTIKYNISNGILSIDGSITDSYTSITSNEGYIYFGYRTANNIYSINLKYYEIIIFDKNSNSILCHLVPVRIGQVGYMRDKISGKLYGNSGTGDFVLGPDKT